MNLKIKETAYMSQSKTDDLSSFLISFFIFFALTKVPKLIIHSAVNENFNSVVELH